MNKIVKLIISIMICLFAGFLGALFNMVSLATWYVTLKKPFFNPPNWLFSPVWTALFIMMGIALYLVWDKKYAKTLFFSQLALNVLWSGLFFGMRNPLLAFVDIVLLWIAILANIIAFRKISKTASYLMVPYILWVSFAAVLNLAIVLLN